MQAYAGHMHDVRGRYEVDDGLFLFCIISPVLFIPH